MDHSDSMTEGPYADLSAMRRSTFTDAGRAWLVPIYTFIGQHESKASIKHLRSIFHRPLQHSKNQMAIVDVTASTADVDSIAPVVAHRTELPTPTPAIDPVLTDRHEPHAIEAIHLDEGDGNVRTKIRTLAIVSALYFVLFIAALDQTIIA